MIRYNVITTLWAHEIYVKVYNPNKDNVSSTFAAILLQVLVVEPWLFRVDIVCLVVLEVESHGPGSKITWLVASFLVSAG